MTEIEKIQSAFLRRQGWRFRADIGWSPPQRPFAWFGLQEAYERASGTYRHWTSLKERRAMGEENERLRRHLENVAAFVNRGDLASAQSYIAQVSADCASQEGK